jgi:hypothetical protein
MPSLLPYLKSNDSKLHINIIETPVGTAELVPKRTIFRVLSESSPLTRLLRAEIFSDAGSLVQPVFLLVQKDVYRYQPSELWPLTNLDVEASWQQAHSFFDSEASGKTPTGTIEHAVIRLGTQWPAGSNPSAFQCLFVCSHRQIFFHPPCPGCGQSLLLCKDDALLLSQGLSPYTSSLRRYLYCPSCPSAKEGNGFYVSSIDATDSRGVQDCSGLIVAWRYLLAAGLAPVGFPCLNCPESGKCHGAENLAAVRMVPFGFYPFHMLVIKAMTIRAADFLPLVSRANMADVASQLLKKNESARCSDLTELRRMVGDGDLFLFEGTGKDFLEVLYLKLSFLDELTKMTQNMRAPLDINAALDCIWVKLPTIGGFLPRFWNFSVGYMDIGLTREAAMCQPDANEAHLSYFLGVLWFHVLLSNALQPAAEITACLAELIQSNLQTNPDIQNTPLFSAENIFWNPAAHPLKNFPFEWKELWRKTLELAWALLLVSRSGAPRVSDKFRKDLSAIRHEIKKQLFVEGSVPAGNLSQVPSGVSDDPAIHKILSALLSKWESPRNSVSAGMAEPTDIWAETIVLNKDKIEETLQETVLITKDNVEEELEKTVIISNVKTAPASVKPSVPIQETGEDVPCETVILSGKAPDKPPLSAPPAAPIAQERGANDGDDLLSETIILRSPQK